MVPPGTKHSARRLQLHHPFPSHPRRPKLLANRDSRRVSLLDHIALHQSRRCTRKASLTYPSTCAHSRGKRTSHDLYGIAARLGPVATTQARHDTLLLPEQRERDRKRDKASSFWAKSRGPTIAASCCLFERSPPTRPVLVLAAGLVASLSGSPPNPRLRRKGPFDPFLRPAPRPRHRRSISEMPPTSTAQQKVLVAQFISLTGATERQAVRVSLDPALHFESSFSPLPKSLLVRGRELMSSAAVPQVGWVQNQRSHRCVSLLVSPRASHPSSSSSNRPSRTYAYT